MRGSGVHAGGHGALLFCVCVSVCVFLFHSCPLPSAIIYECRMNLQSINATT